MEKLGKSADEFYFSDDLIKTYKTAAERMRENATETPAMKNPLRKLSSNIESTQNHKAIECCSKHEAE